ncbi:hypothetical protein [Obesumbacterium proteus]|uniref:hypothetical protein n=1 Tax=Obesumbacterium proteus TaxID=82983 RepID=UPI000778B746|nr:hypothetical protein [Obesumbacterium proteus]AMO82889.1 hypothetical protein DSM2777_18705 [Obesumbacterium proteus]
MFLKLLNNTTIQTDSNNINITNIDWSGLINRINKFILSKENYWITSTTIEGCLINEKSLILFKKWMLSEVLKNLNPKKLGI